MAELVEYEELTPDEHLQLWRQFVESQAESQRSYDVSVRTLAAGGIAVTTSLVAALHTINATGDVALAAFVAGLLANVVSHLSADHDMASRLSALESRPKEYPLGNRWGLATTALNYAAGAAVVIGGLLLAVFVAGAH